MRSRAAASVLKAAGFGDVHSMEGGIDAWRGGTAVGSPDRSTTYFLDAASPEHMMALAWSMEEGARRFYYAVSEKMEDPNARALFSTLARAERHHQESLDEIHRRLYPQGDRFESLVGGASLVGNVMEGGFSTEEAVARYAGLPREDVLAFALAMETTSYDLYLRMRSRVEDDRGRRTFELLAEEEKAHLDRLSRMMDETL